MPSRASSLDQLAKVPLFAGLSRKDLQLLARESDQVTVEAGRVLTREGESGHEFFLILDGRCSVRRGNRKIATLGPGQWFGELAVLAKGPRTATVLAEEPTTLLVLGQRELLGILDEVPAVSVKMLRTLAERVRDSGNRSVAH
jgi:CRP-like cAMP-binding protein